MIIHYKHDKPVSVYVVNSRLPVYRAYYVEGLGDIISGLFTRMAPKVALIVKQLSMKAIDVIRDKGISAAEDVAGRAFSAAKKQTNIAGEKKKTTSVAFYKVSKVIKTNVIVGSAAGDSIAGDSNDSAAGGAINDGFDIHQRAHELDSGKWSQTKTKTTLI